jgi:putative Holliday junction resolvase
VPEDEAGSVLAIDLGVRRTGLARSDPGRRVAFGLSTFEVQPGRSLRARLTALHREVPFTGVVLGLPFHADGRPGVLSKRVERLGGWILARFGVPVAFLDERLTSFAAEQLRDEAGGACRDSGAHRDSGGHRNSGARRDKGLVDRLAAQVILREFLAAGCPFSSSGRPAGELTGGLTEDLAEEPTEDSRP